MKGPALSLLLLLFWGGAPAALRAYIRVDPSAQQLMVPPGGALSGEITINNMTDQPRRVAVKVQDWRYEGPAGGKAFLPPGTSSGSCSGWTTFSPTEISLPPRGAATVRYTINVPKDARGGYQTMLLFSAAAAADDARKKEGINIDVAMQMATILIVEAAGTRDLKGTVTVFEPVDARAGAPLTVKAGFRNEGNVRVAVKGKISLMDKKGQGLGWTQFPEIKTLPGDQWTVEATLPKPLEVGTYELIGTFELAPGVVILKEKEIRVP